MTKALAQFFRLTLSGGLSIICVKDEIDHAKQYLKIQKIRYVEKLSYSFDVDSAIADCKVPKIILQPIIENAIYHGIKEKDGAGAIMVKASSENEYLRFYVTDDGAGFHVQSIKPDGVGIKNVDERLKLQYGSDCGVGIESEIGKGTTVILMQSANK